jgi:hypothetical protein
LRALLDKKEYLGGGKQLLHMRFPSKQPGRPHVKNIGPAWRGMNHSRAKTGRFPLHSGDAEVRSGGDGGYPDLFWGGIVAR